MRKTITYCSILMSLIANACQQRPTEDTKPKEPTIYHLPSEMVQDKDGNLRFKDNYLIPKDTSDRNITVYPSKNSNDTLNNLNVN